MTDVAIQVENLSKRYRIGLKEDAHDTLGSAVAGIIAGPIKNFRRLRSLSRFSKNGHEAEDIIWALKDVSFEVKEGEVIGIIGRNGAGKSTLLKILCRITQPTEGRARINGRVGSLLEVGTGFHPELTGRDNVYLNGTILGMTRKEVQCKFDEIVDFSSVEKFIDTPLKRYSTGMKVRLAFAVAAHLEPEILIIDEVLAVGDTEFQKKCLDKMDDVARGGRTILFVSHNMTSVLSLCHRVLVMADGSIVFDGDADQSVQQYLATVRTEDRAGSYKAGEHTEEGAYRISAARVTSSGRYNPDGYPTGEPLEFTVECQLPQKTRRPVMRIAIETLQGQGQRIFTLHSDFKRDATQPWNVSAGKCTFRCKVPNLALMPGEYSANLVLELAGTDLARILTAFVFRIRESDRYPIIERKMQGLLVPEQEWSIE